MKLSVYVPESLEDGLRREAAEARLSLTKFIQSVLRDRLEEESDRFSATFAALAGSWEDGRMTSAILRDIEKGRATSRRPRLR